MADDQPFDAPNRQPPPPRQPTPGIPLWTLHKDAETISAELRHGEHQDAGYELVLSRNGEWFFGRRYLSGAIALEEAAGCRRGYEAEGWKESEGV